MIKCLTGLRLFITSASLARDGDQEQKGVLLLRVANNAKERIAGTSKEFITIFVTRLITRQINLDSSLVT